MIRDEVLLFSGGTDSFIAWKYLNKPACLYVDLNTTYSKAELVRVKELASKYSIDLIVDNRLDLGDQEFKDTSGFVPHRNTFLILIASFYANRIWYAGLGSDVVIDKNPKYSLNLSQFLTEQLSHRALSVVVDSPFWNYTKEDTIRILMNLVGKLEAKKWLLDTFSCYSDTKLPCGKCQACFRRYVALKLHGIEEDYEINPLRGCREQILQKYIPEMLRSLDGTGRYHLRRSIETLGLIFEDFRSEFKLIPGCVERIRNALRIEKEKIVKQFNIEPEYTLSI